MRINIAKVCLVKSIGGLHCELLLIAPFLFFKFLYIPSLWLFEKITFKILNEYDRQKTSKLLYKHADDIDIFIMKRGKNSSLWWTLWQIVQQMTITKICPLKRHFEYMSIITIKKKSLSLIEFFVGIIIFNQVNQTRCDQRLCNQNKNSIIRWLACKM